MAEATENPPPEAAPATKTDELLKVVEDQESPEVFKSAVTSDDSIGEKGVQAEEEDTTDEEDASNRNWKEVLPPPPPPTNPDDADEKYEAVLTSPTEVKVDETGGKGAAQPPPQDEQPDFSNYKTNVARRLWEAQETAEKAGVKSSSDMVPLTREFQKYRTGIGHTVC